MSFKFSVFRAPNIVECLQKALLLRKWYEMCVKYGGKKTRAITTTRKPSASRPRGCPCFALTFTLFNTRLQRFSGAYKWNWGLNSQGSIQDPRYPPGVACSCRGLSLCVMIHGIARHRVPDGQRYMRYVSRNRTNCLILLCAQLYYAE